MATRDYCVYWLFDDTCSTPSDSGYIGACSRLDVRLRQHRLYFGTHKGGINVPAEFRFAVLFVGPENECLAIERLFRPNSNIGWNVLRGGGRSARGTKHTAKFKRMQAKSASERFRDVPKPIGQREKMAEAGLARYADRKPRPESYERQRLAKNAKRAARRAAGLPRLY